MKPLPRKQYLKAGDVINGGYGITQYAFYQAVSSGAIRSVKLPGMTYAHYLRKDIMTAFKLEEENAHV